MSAPAPSMFTPEAQLVAGKLGLAWGRPNLEEFAATLVEEARQRRDILVVTSDSRGSGKLAPFAQAFPDRMIEVGIAEQNLVGIAAGLAACGKRPFAVSPASFLTARALEQIKNDVCYSDVPAVLVGISAGVSYGALGSTHHSLHDIAALRTIHNVEVVVPADNVETREVIRHAARSARPVYIRFGKAPTYTLHKKGANFEVGKAVVLREGNDATLIGTGETVVHCLLAAAALAERGLDCRVISMPWIKPLDEQAVIRAGRECRAMVIAEEHSVHGGLGEACASTLMSAGVSLPFKIFGLPDEDTVTGAQADIFRHYGLSMEGLRDAVLKLRSR